jgi:hypothetical protein
MKVRWRGIGIRIMDPYSWTPENKFIQDVPLEKAADLVTYPGSQFELVDPDEMPEIVSFVEGDPRPIETLKRRRKRPSTKYKE